MSAYLIIFRGRHHQSVPADLDVPNVQQEWILHTITESHSINQINIEKVIIMKRNPRTPPRSNRTEPIVSIYNIDNMDYDELSEKIKSLQGGINDHFSAKLAKVQGPSPTNMVYIDEIDRTCSRIETLYRVLQKDKRAPPSHERSIITKAPTIEKLTQREKSALALKIERIEKRRRMSEGEDARKENSEK